MDWVECDITTYSLIDSESVGMISNYIWSLEQFRCRVVNPSLKALTDKLDELNLSDDEGSVFQIADIEQLMRRTIEGYLLTLQSMWERGLRGMLANCESRICNGRTLDAIKTATWGGKSENLKEHFLRLVGVSIHNFSSYKDLDFLQALGNAIRHGDGNSAERVYHLCPTLWPNIFAPDELISLDPIGQSLSTNENVPPQFGQIDIPVVVLEQMMKSVLWFWEDVENMRCNSFRRKSSDVVHKLSTWREHIGSRVLHQTWSLEKQLD